VSPRELAVEVRQALVSHFECDSRDWFVRLLKQQHCLGYPMIVDEGAEGATCGASYPPAE
jgi:hypothetical protein